MLLPLLGKTQAYSYKPFPDSVATWVEHYEYSGGDQLLGTSYYMSACDIFVMQGDTLLADSTLWNKIWLYSSYYDTIPERYFGGMKEDSAQKIWLWLSDGSLPFMIYDFSLTTGDTFTLSIPGEGDFHALVTNDDSFAIPSRAILLNFDTLIYSNLPSVYMTGQWSVLQWQEGIGSVNYGASGGSLMYFYTFFSSRTSGAQKTLLYFNDDSISLGTYVCIDTEYYSGPINVPNVQDFNTLLYPNPGTNSVVIELNKGTIGGTLQVYAVDGRKMYDSNIMVEKIILNTTDWHNGTYFIQLVYGDKRKMLRWVKYE